MKLSLLKFLFLLLLIPSAFSCSFLNEDDDYIYYSWASVQKVEIISNQRGKLDLKVRLTIPTPCNEYHTKEIIKQNDTLHVRYFSKIKRETICIQILGEMEIRDTFVLQSGKTYLFKFFRNQNSTLDTLITIN